MTTVLTARFGGFSRDYWRLWCASAVSNLGDGLALIALPWLATTLTADPVAIAGVAVVLQLPWVLFSLLVGAIADRIERRRLMAGASALRVVAAGLTAGAVAAGVMSLPLLYLAALLLGLCEVVFDTSSQTLLPAVVDPERLEQANGNLWAAEIVLNNLAARPLAGALIAVSLAVPFAVDAVTAATAVLLLTAMRPRDRPAAALSDDRSSQPSLRGAIAEGVRWLWDHRLLRTLALVLTGVIAANSAATAVLVLFAQEVLALDAFGFGLLSTAAAVGGILGSQFTGPLTRMLGHGAVLLLGLAIPGAAFIGVALTSQAWHVGVLFVVSGFFIVGWNVVTVSLRQRLAPTGMLGRINSVYRFLGWGLAPIGILLGGLLASGVELVASRELGLRTPLLAAGIIHFFLLLIALPRLRSDRINAALDAAHPNTP